MLLADDCLHNFSWPYLTYIRSQCNVIFDGQSASLGVMHPSEVEIHIFVIVTDGFLDVRTISNDRTGLSFRPAGGPRQRSVSAFTHADGRNVGTKDGGRAEGEEM
jgi:uncharacterized protein YgiB involved in biofilm formation